MTTSPAIVLDRHGSIDDRGGRRPAAKQCRHVDEGLERRTRLAERVGGAVEFAFLVIAAADHRLHGAVGLHGDDRRLSRVVGRRLEIDRFIDEVVLQAGTTRLRLSVAAGVTVHADRNTWLANVQGADSAGHYDTALCGGASPCDVSSGAGANYTFDGAGAGAKLRLAE